MVLHIGQDMIIALIRVFDIYQTVIITVLSFAIRILSDFYNYKD